ncbi:MBL fold metallo-hydrolase [Zoogloea sp.]|uniref:MBL fold metallo-hydrolase n=1 Tax=Zoogloea sp. TaxID=49181 RepID=UPI00261F6B16|nr:MBL fold metallo-hydrolase [Zoogloea sp.]MDD3353746.1 MBL fold metallo-hydrolase [Zoogloea sp.]
MSRVALPAGIQVLERGWLSANNVVLTEGGGAVVVDSGHCHHAEQTVDLLRDALDGATLDEVVCTHGHVDHMGGNARLQAVFGCPVAVPEGLFERVNRWDEEALLLRATDQQGDRFTAARAVRAGERRAMGGYEWVALPAPGHDMDALVFHAPDARVLISGDALWRDGFGILFVELYGEGGGIEATRQTLEAIARLPVDLVIPGHGAPFVEVDEALEAAFARLRAFEEDGARIARNGIRALFAFRLMEQRAFTLDDLPDYLDRVPIYREANRRFLGLSPDALASWLQADLVRAGVARREGDLLHAT